MMENVYLQEAFKALDILNEEDFSLSSVDGLKDAKEFIDKEEESDFVDIIDPEAETEEELKDSYVGDVILDCTVCHSKIYKNPEEVHISEDEELANIDEECPFCYSTDGYEIIGMVAPYEEKKEEEEVEIEDTEEVEEEPLEEGIGGTLLGGAGGALLGGAALGPLGAIGGALAGGLAGNALTNNKEEKLEEDADISEYQKWVDFDMEKYGRISRLTMQKIKKAGFSVVKDQYGEYEVIADRKDEKLEKCDECDKKEMKEHFEKVEIETDTEKMEMTSEPDGKTVIVTEPKEKEEEIVAPVSDEIQAEINPVKDEPEEEFDDVEVDEFSEEEFNELGESYLKKVYENVNSFKTSNVKTAENKLVIEGIIGFNSGKQKKTSFVFESKDINKNGKVRFIGENLQLSRGKKSFTMTGKITEGKFIAESLNYNYRAKDSDGKSTRLYGTMKLSEAKKNLPIQSILNNANIDLDSDPEKGIKQAIELVKASDSVSDKDKLSFERNLSSGPLGKKLSTIAAYMTGMTVGR